MKTLVILPTYNEAENILPMLTAIRALNLPLDILVIDDNSPDQTADKVKGYRAALPEAQRSGVELYERAGKLGLGSAYRSGFKYALEQKYDAAIEMDSDFSHPPAALAIMLETLKSHDVAIGSRYVKGGSIPDWAWWRRLVSLGGNLYASTIMGAGIRDLTGGFNGFTAKALKKLNYEKVASNGYDFQIEIKLRAKAAGLSCHEFPIVFKDRRVGQSKIPKTYLFSALIKVLWWRLRGFKTVEN